MASNQLNPYASPQARLSDAEVAPGQFIAEGTTVTAGQGWRWIHAGFMLFKQQPVAAILIILVFVAIQFALAGLQMGLGMLHPALAIIAGLASLAVTPVLIGGWMLGCRAVDEGESLRVGHLFAAIASHGKPLMALAGWLLLAMLAIGLVVMAIAGIIGFAAGGAGAGTRGMNIVFGATIAILVTIVLMMLVYSLVWFAPALIVLHDLSALDAMKASVQGCLKNIIPFLVYSGCAIGLAIAASIPFMLGWIVFAPVLVASIYAAYRDIYFA